MEEQKIIECSICGEETTMLGTKLCDRCWKLKTRINNSYEIAKKIILQYEKDHEIKPEKRIKLYTKAHSEDSTMIEIYSKSDLVKIKILWAIVHEDFFINLGSTFEPGTPLNRMQQNDEMLCFELKEIKELGD